MLKQSLKRRLPRGLTESIRSLNLELQIARIHRKSVRKARLLQPPFRLHIGSGDNLKPGWVNIDLNPLADLRLDLREDLPFPDDSVSVIYSEHFFEHLMLADGQRFLAECWRVLSPGGHLSVGVPDGELSCKSYVFDSRPEWEKIRDRYHPKSCTTPMHSVNYFFRQDGEHKYIYDFETLSEVIHAAGFVNVVRRDWRSDLDLPSRRDGTLYVDAEKTI